MKGHLNAAILSPVIIGLIAVFLSLANNIQLGIKDIKHLDANPQVSQRRDSLEYQASKNSLEEGWNFVYHIDYQCTIDQCCFVTLNSK